MPLPDRDAPVRRMRVAEMFCQVSSASANSVQAPLAVLRHDKTQLTANKQP